MTRVETTRSLEDLAQQGEGFVYVEHDKGGHSFDDHTTPSFFESLEDLERILDLYRRSIEASADRFEALKERLADLNILGETLVMFTSDHGELLGERPVVASTDTVDRSSRR